MKVHILIMAAGAGTRFGAPLPKQYCLLAGKPVIVHTVERLRCALPSAALTVVISEEHQHVFRSIAAEYGLDGVGMVYGGATRWESVSNALKQLHAAPGDVVMVHDGARPLVEAPVVERLLDALAQGADGAIPVVAVVDSLREVDPQGGSRSVDRARFRAVQTPQAFPAAKLMEAYRLPYRATFTDDASVMAAAGFTDLRLVEGDPRTLKITHPLDLLTVQAIIDTHPTDR